MTIQEVPGTESGSEAAPHPRKGRTGRTLWHTAIYMAGLILLPFSSLLTMLFYTCVLAFSVPVNDMPLTVGDFRVYGSDFSVYFVGGVAAYALWMAAR